MKSDFSLTEANALDVLIRARVVPSKRKRNSSWLKKSSAVTQTALQTATGIEAGSIPDRLRPVLELNRVTDRKRLSLDEGKR